MLMTELCGSPSAVLQASTAYGKSAAAARGPGSNAAARTVAKSWRRRFKLGGRIRAVGGQTKIFQKPLAAGMKWATFPEAQLRTGAPFFLLKDGFNGPVTESNCVHTGPFFFSAVVKTPAIRGKFFLERRQRPGIVFPTAHGALVNGAGRVVVSRRKHEFLAVDFVESLLLRIPRQP